MESVIGGRIAYFAGLGGLHCSPAVKDRDYCKHDRLGRRKRPGPKSTKLKMRESPLVIERRICIAIWELWILAQLLRHPVHFPPHLVFWPLDTMTKNAYFTNPE